MFIKASLLRSLTGPFDKVGAVACRRDRKMGAQVQREVPSIQYVACAGIRNMFLPSASRTRAALSPTTSILLQILSRVTTVPLLSSGCCTAKAQVPNDSVHHTKAEATASLPDTLTQDANYVFHSINHIPGPTWTFILMWDKYLNAQKNHAKRWLSHGQQLFFVSCSL